MRFLLRVVALAAASAVSVSSFELPCGARFPLTDANVKLYQGVQEGTIDRNSFSPAAFGATDPFAFKTKSPKPWPRDKDGIATIKYCYDSAELRKEIHEDNEIEEAMRAWEEALGGKAGPESGHAISFVETRDSLGEVQYCTDPRADNEWKWNDQLPYDILAIRRNEKYT